MLTDPIASKYIARSCRGSNSRRNAGAHLIMPAIIRTRIDDLLLATPRYSARLIGYLQSLADISASSGIPVKGLQAVFFMKEKIVFLLLVLSNKQRISQKISHVNLVLKRGK